MRGRGTPLGSIGEERHRRRVATPEQHGAPDGARAEPLPHVVDRLVEGGTVDAVEGERELHRAVVGEGRRT